MFCVFWFCFVFSGQPSFNFALFWLVMTTSWEFASLAYFAEAVAAQRSRNCSLSNRVPEGGARAPELAQRTTSCSAGQGACTSLRSFSHRVLAPSQNKQPATQALSQSDAIWRPQNRCIDQCRWKLFGWFCLFACLAVFVFRSAELFSCVTAKAVGIWIQAGNSTAP